VHGLPTLASKAFIFEGLQHTSYVVEYTENPECMSHYTLNDVVHLKERSSEITLAALLERAQRDLGREEVVVEFSRDVIERLECPSCRAAEDVFRPVGTVSFEQGKCPNDGHLRTVTIRHSFAAGEAIGQRKLSELGLPQFDVFTARSAQREIGYLLGGDADAVLGELGRAPLERYGEAKT